MGELVPVGDLIAIANREQLFLVDTSTLVVTTIDHGLGPTSILAYHGHTVWLISDGRDGGHLSIASLDTDSLEVGTAFAIEPFVVSSVIGAAGDGVLRYQVPLFG